MDTEDSKIVIIMDGEIPCISLDEDFFSPATARLIYEIEIALDYTEIQKKKDENFLENVLKELEKMFEGYDI